MSNRATQRGLTVLEMMVGFVVVAVALGGLGYLWNAGWSDTVRAKAQNDARDYSRAMHPTWPRVVVDCQGVDSDEDGYVRCTIGNGGDITESIECRTSRVMDYQRGCVPMRMAPRMQSN